MNKKNIIVIGILAIIAIIAAGVFVVLKKEKNPVNQDQQQTNDQQSVQDNSQQDIDTSDWKTYRNEEHGFSMQYPKNLVLKDDSAGQDFSLGFHDGDRNGSLQISIFVSNKKMWSLEEREILNKKIQGEKVSTERIYLRNIPVLKTKFGGGPQVPPIDEIYFIYNNKTYIFSFTVGNFSIITDEYESRIFNSIKFE